MKVGYISADLDSEAASNQFQQLLHAGCEAVVGEDAVSALMVNRTAFVACLFRLQPGDELVVCDFSVLNVNQFIGHLNALRLRGVHFLTFDDYGLPELVDVWVQASAEMLNFRLNRKRQVRRKQGYVWQDLGSGRTDLEVYQLREVGCDPVVVEQGAASVASTRPALALVLERLGPGEILVFSKEADLPGCAFSTALCDAIRRGVYFFLYEHGDEVLINDRLKLGYKGEGL